ncbi:MAG: MBL fold metallo-hydrolase [Syntrophales bacterium]|nr:MBL fold metallo-hydrolase [Syntrophales bacterium]
MVHVIPKCGFAKTYLLEEKRGIIAVDVGSRGAARDVENYTLNVLGRPLSDIIFIIATHFHIDHIGGIATLLAKCSSITKVIFHEEVAHYIEGRKGLATMKNWMKCIIPVIRGDYQLGSINHIFYDSLTGVPLPYFRYRNRVSYAKRIDFVSCTADTPQVLDSTEWMILHTPGHTPDSISLYNAQTNELICGDLILGRKAGGGQLNQFHYDAERIITTYETLRKSLKVKRLYPGHGSMIFHEDDAFLKISRF